MKLHALNRCFQRNKRISFWLIPIFILSFEGCGQTLQLTSHWKNREVIIDGKNTEWKDTLVALDDHGTSVGLLNDGRYIFIGLMTVNRDIQRQIMRSGLTFWFDPMGGKDKKFGVHYPLGFGGAGFQGGNRSEAGGNSEGRESEDSGERQRPFEPETSWTSSDELEIYGPGEEVHHRMTIAETGGIDVRVRTSNGVLVYELKVPLADNGPQPFAIGTKPGALIGVGVESSNTRVERSLQGESDAGGEGRGHGRRGSGGRGGGERGGGGGQRSGGQTEPLSIWAKVQLAPQDSVSR